MRRLTAAAGIAVALLGLSACRSAPGVAAYVGSDQITEARVTQLVDEVAKIKSDADAAAATAAAAAKKAQEEGKPDAQQQAALAAQASETAQAVVVPSRETVVQTLVLGKVCGQLQADKKFPNAQVTKDQVVQSENIPPATEYAQVRTDALACFYGIPASPVKPTEADLREVYRNGVAAGAIDPSNKFEDLVAQLSSDQQLAVALGARQELAAAAKAANISVNPRYRELSFPVLRFQKGPAISAPLGQPASDAVTAS